MPGKCRPSLRGKTLENVMRSSLSSTDKKCIKAVFERYEAELVVHGRWERVPSNGIGGTARCSICGKAIYGYHAMNYCPTCGAKMDGGDAG